MHRTDLYLIRSDWVVHCHGDIVHRYVLSRYGVVVDVICVHDEGGSACQIPAITVRSAPGIQIVQRQQALQRRNMENVRKPKRIET